MITLPQLITTDTDVAAGLQSGKAVDSPEDFLALLAGALGAGDAQGKDAPLSLADLQKFSQVIGDDVYPILSLQSCLDKRAAKGGVSPQQVAQAIDFAKARL